jgi:hypothetical protein
MAPLELVDHLLCLVAAPVVGQRGGPPTIVSLPSRR